MSITFTRITPFGLYKSVLSSLLFCITAYCNQKRKEIDYYDNIQYLNALNTVGIGMPPDETNLNNNNIEIQLPVYKINLSDYIFDCITDACFAYGWMSLGFNLVMPTFMYF